MQSKQNIYSPLKYVIDTYKEIDIVLVSERKNIDLNKNIISINKKLNDSGLKKKDFYVNHYLKSQKFKAIIPITNQLKKICKIGLK